MKKLHLLSSLLLASSAFAVRAQTTAFTYQGHLDNSSAPAAGTYDVVFSLYGVLSGGSAIAGPVTNTITAKQGAFTTTLDFGSAPFSGAELFLQMSVRENPAPSGTLFSDLTPRQRLTSTPYAIRALSAATADSAATATTASTVSAGSVVNASLQNSSITGNLWYYFI